MCRIPEWVMHYVIITIIACISIAHFTHGVSLKIRAFGCEGYGTVFFTLGFLYTSSVGDEAADLVDCHQGLHLLQLPSRVFWSGFEDMSGE